ncbi:MAG: MarR family transcriptional regulator, partial [Planctomycetes bacterium]|nr:MarR family transcriptional regulator [Planctomycetota bacterium]
MESWKEFEQNPVTHSAAHHLVAIAELLAEFGYARVSDVARKLEITRGSVSVTLKALKQRGLVAEDEHRHLRLSPVGERIARGVSAKRHVLKQLFTRALGVNDAQAEVDT